MIDDSKAASTTVLAEAIAESLKLTTYNLYAIYTDRFYMRTHLC